MNSHQKRKLSRSLIVMNEEEKWFERYTWKHEVGTSIVYFKLKNSANSVLLAKGLEKFLSEELGLENVSTNTTERVKTSGSRGKRVGTVEKVKLFSGWKIDMVNRTFSRISYIPTNDSIIRRKSSDPDIILAWPSQIAPFMEEKRGALNGQKFDI